MIRKIFLLLIILSAALVVVAQQPSNNPFTPIETNREVISVNFREFASIPSADNGAAPRMMHTTTEPGTERLFVSTMPGLLYSISYDGQSVVPYIDIVAAPRNIAVNSAGRERGLQSFAFHPQFAQSGAPGYGKFYTYTDAQRGGNADYETSSDNHSHDTVLHEWTAGDATAAHYDGGAPREIFRVAQPFANHNGGEIAFNPLASGGDDDFGLLYIGLADGGSGGDSLGVGQNLASPFAKILRIDPLGNNSSNGQYGIPTSNPFVDDVDARTLGEIYAYGVRNPQRFGWDRNDGRMLVADIGQNQVEEISPITSGANLGWNRWGGSYRFINRQVSMENPRGEPGFTWPLVEYDHNDPLWIGRAAITGVVVNRESTIPQLQDKMIFGDVSSGELLYVPANASVNGGHQQIRRILLNDGGTDKNLLQLIREANAEQGRSRAQRADLRFGIGPEGQIFLLNKADGVIRVLVP
ncbi:MAG: PQQ-dependent sugar dehydrogenase [Gammaproteobacteria bacterium]|nr:PQQ-dependent sugar dehydrogenase [Gammaproteobacteria bacterium]